MTPEAWWSGFVEKVLDPATAVDVLGQLLATAVSLMGAVWLFRTQLRHDRKARQHTLRAEDARRLADRIACVGPTLHGSSEMLGQYLLNHRRPPFAELTEEIRRHGLSLRIGFDAHPIRRRLTELTTLWRVANGAKADLKLLPAESVGYAVRALLADTVDALEQAADELRYWDGVSSVAPCPPAALEGLMPPDSDLEAREKWRTERRRAIVEIAHRRAGVEMAPPVCESGS
ncbi:hypothetical protein [Curtobacterium flaccumfaciens]|uniref:hypothetical protein n=1 Tax=Curtobacterium flaccumfaciens TaxID=2035 RepID=UPI00217E1967|nr:hypothetical protein [Curtobacterium flaccumfaciens]MCS6588110.1 hypothetical protein [Curtobacterium flaccumfaciens pv. flaccumfaciens]